MTHIANGKKIAAMALIMIGLFSFLAPLVVTDPPVMGRSRWSLLDIVHGYQGGKLPRDADNIGFWILALHFGAIYLLLILAGTALYSFPGQQLLMWIGLIGAIITLEMLRQELEFKALFYGHPMSYGVHASGHVRYAGIASLLFTAMVVIFFSPAILAKAIRDRGRPRPRWRLKSQQPPEHRNL